jgi:hypothetical protein
VVFATETLALSLLKLSPTLCADIVPMRASKKIKQAIFPALDMM